MCNAVAEIVEHQDPVGKSAHTPNLTLSNYQAPITNVLLPFRLSLPFRLVEHCGRPSRR
jgi:hypothetical protein